MLCYPGLINTRHHLYQQFSHNLPQVQNMELASGVARIPEMLRLGVPVGLAVDGSASQDGSSLLEELRICFLLHRLRASKQAPTGYDVLKLAARSSVRLLAARTLAPLRLENAPTCSWWTAAAWNWLEPPATP